jgi:hypothetical protein
MSELSRYFTNEIEFSPSNSTIFPRKNRHAHDTDFSIKSKFDDQSKFALIVEKIINFVKCYSIKSQSLSIP